MSITIWCYTPTVLVQANMTAWDLLKTNYQSSFKWERSPQAIPIKSRAFRVQESSSQIMKNSFLPYQSYSIINFWGLTVCQAVTWVISLDKTLSLVLPLSSWMSLGKLQYVFLFLHVSKMRLIPICLPHRIEISTRDNPRKIIWENVKDYTALICLAEWITLHWPITILTIRWLATFVFPYLESLQFRSALGFFSPQNTGLTCCIFSWT